MFSSKIKKYLISLLVFLLPTQLAYHFWPNYSFIFGVRVDYFAPTIYLTDIISIIIIFFNLPKLKKYYIYFILALLLALVNIFYSNLFFVSLYKWIKLFEFAFLAICIKGEKIEKPLYYSLVFFSIIGIAQFLIEGTTGMFYLLGERSFDVNTAGVALVEIFNRSFLRAYSTFPHPNVMAGYLALSIIFLFHKKFKFNKFIIFPIICFLLNFSLSAFLGVLVYFVLNEKYYRYYLIPVILISFSLPFIHTRINLGNEYLERIKLAQEAGSVIGNNLWFGSGLGTFPKYSHFRQPVHNLLLLIFSEIGIFGLIGVLIVIYKKINIFQFLIFVLTVGLFDHYFLTLQQSSLLLFIISLIW